MKKGDARKRYLDILIRYALLILIALPNLWIFYFIFTPLTSYPVYYLLNIFYDASLLNSTLILINSKVPIELIPACIAGAAYYLLLILNLSTPGIELKQRLNLIAISFISFLILNILRIVFLTMIYFVSFNAFIITHQIFWYSMSTLFVVVIWFAMVRLFKINEIPFYSDVKFLYKKIRG